MAMKYGVAKKLHVGSLVTVEDEPCRVCGSTIGPAQAVWVGWSQGNESRAAHRSCWYKNVPKEEWKYPEDSTQT